MSKYTITFSVVRTELEIYKFDINAKSLEDAKLKAQSIADDDNGTFEDNYAEYCSPGDSYVNINVEEIKEK